MRNRAKVFYRVLHKQGNGKWQKRQMHRDEKQKIEGIRCYKQHRTNIKENEELEHICTQNTAYAHQVPKFISIICYSHIRSLFSFYRNVALILWLVLPEFHASWQIIVYIDFCARSSSKKYIQYSEPKLKLYQKNDESFGKN